jgi:hypothetical protein
MANASAAMQVAAPKRYPASQQIKTELIGIKLKCTLYMFCAI